MVGRGGVIVRLWRRAGELEMLSIDNGIFPSSIYLCFMTKQRGGGAFIVGGG